MMEERHHWTIEDYKEYLNNHSAPNELKRLKNKVTETVINLAGIQVKFGYKVAVNISNEIRNDMADYFFKTISYKMAPFLTKNIQDILTKTMKRLNVTLAELPCKDNEKICVKPMKSFFKMIHTPFEVNKMPFFNLGFGTYLAYFSRFISSDGGGIAFLMHPESKVLERESQFIGPLTDVLNETDSNVDLARNLTIIEMVRALHKQTDEISSKEKSFASNAQIQHDCTDRMMGKYADAWNTVMESEGLLGITPCQNVSYFAKNLLDEFTNCCVMLQMIQKRMPTVMKVMKYSIQSARFQEPLDDFLESVNNLNLLPYNNLTSFRSKEKYRQLMDITPNPRVFICSYMQQERLLPPFCNLFHASITDNGIGFTFNNVNFWDMFSSTEFTKNFAEIWRPKGFNEEPSRSLDNFGLLDDYSWVYPNKGIEFPFQSGSSGELMVKM